MSALNLENAKADALARFADSGPDRLNCAQAVLRFALIVTGIDPDLVVAGRYFGGGIARTGEACGAVTGAALALGVRDSQLPEQTPDEIALTMESLQNLLRDFAVEFGSRRCCELTGHDLGTPEGYRAFRESPAHERCPGYVGWICDRLAPLLTNVGLPVDPVRS
jgi:C_GCAxxG_C_C family probable redox protein